MPWTRLCRIDAESLTEASGLIVARRNPGVLWLHNDSGDGPKLYAIDADSGRRRATLSVRGASAVDWEAGGIDPQGRILVADIGDNNAKRKSVALYRFAEPQLPPGKSELTADAERLIVTYPGGANDAEALLIHPTTGAAHIVTKVLGGGSEVYRVPDTGWRSGRAVLQRVAALSLPMAGGGLRKMALSALVTDGAAAPDLSAVYLLTYAHLLRFAWPKGKPLEAAFAGSPTIEAIPKELKQAEAVAFGPDGRLYVTSEGKHAPIFVR